MEPETTNKDLALLLFSAERAGGSSASELPSAIHRTFEKLNAHLSTRLGSGGYDALLKRAVILAAADFPWLASVHITEKGVLDGFERVSEDQTISETAEGCVAILSSLIGLLETFIGVDLCRGVLHAVRPDTIRLDPAAAESSQGDTYG